MANQNSERHWPRDLMDLLESRSPALDRKNAYITEGKDFVSIGGGTTVQEVVESRVIRRLADGILCDAAQGILHLGLRNITTLASIGFDWIEIWEPSVVVKPGFGRLSRGITAEFWLALDALDGLPISRADLHWIEQVKMRIHPQCHGGYARVARTPRDAAVTAAFGTLEISEGKCGMVRLAVSGLAPEIAGEITERAIGKAVSADLLYSIGESVVQAVKPVDDFRASAEYRREMAGVLAKRALEMAWKRATG